MGLEEIIKQKEEEIRRLNESLADLEFYLRDLNTLIPIPVCSLSPLGIIIDVNQAFQMISEYSLIEAIGKPIDALFLEKKQIKEILNNLVEKEYIGDEELTIISKSEKEIPVSLSTSIRRDQENNIIGYFLALLDISERKKFREELTKQVTERTKELQGKIKELEKINRLTVGRELKMIELKKEIKTLKEELNGNKKG